MLNKKQIKSLINGKMKTYLDKEIYFFYLNYKNDNFNISGHFCFYLQLSDMVDCF